MRSRSLVGLLCLAALTSPAARATICVPDPVPAATLLLPYFEVANPGRTTVFSINNASAMAVLAHVTVWSDLSVPVLDFSVYLTGYDVQRIDMRDVLNGKLPQTASKGQDPADTISPKGALSQDINFASCTGLLPLPPLPANLITHLWRSLTGQPSPVLNGLCAGLRYGDNVARGYVTVDTVNNCTLRFPGDPGFFGFGGTGDATNQNVLWGDYFYVDPATAQAKASTLVHIEAAPGIDASGHSTPANPATTTPGQYTFYGRYLTPAWTAVDNREPLANGFATPFVNGGAGPFTRTSLVVWRDSKVNQSAFTCPAMAGRPFWYPLAQKKIMVFDEQEHVRIPAALRPFPAAAQRTAVGGAALPVPPAYIAGWLSLDLNVQVPAPAVNPPINPELAQAWVSTEEMDAAGRYSVGFDAIQLDRVCK